MSTRYQNVCRASARKKYLTLSSMILGVDTLSELFNVCARYILVTVGHNSTLLNLRNATQHLPAMSVIFGLGEILAERLPRAITDSNPSSGTMSRRGGVRLEDPMGTSSELPRRNEFQLGWFPDQEDSKHDIIGESLTEDLGGPKS